MPTIAFTVSAAQGTELTNCFGENYQATINGQPNPETKAQFARQQMIALFKQHILLYRKREAAKTMNAVDPDIT